MLTALLLAARVGSGPALFAVGQARGGSVERAVASDEGSEAARPPLNAPAPPCAGHLSRWSSRLIVTPGTPVEYPHVDCTVAAECSHVADTPPGCAARCWWA